MVLGNGNGHKDMIDRRPATRLAEDSGAGKLGFVRIKCSYSVASAGLTHVLKQAGISHGIEPPPGIGAHCVVLGVQDEKDLPEAMSRVWEKSIGEEATDEEATDECPILIFAPQNDWKLAEAALRAGARGFIHAGMLPKQILRALSVAAKGEIVAPRGLLEFILAAEGPSADLGALSERQIEVLQLVAEGLSNAQIGRRLFLTESTVKQHLRGAFKILGVKNRAQATKVMRGEG